jgi:hypothetical protein
VTFRKLFTEKVILHKAFLCWLLPKLICSSPAQEKLARMTNSEEKEIDTSSSNAEVEESPQNSNKRSYYEMTKDERIEARKAANRQAARESRVRRMKLIEDLQNEVDELTIKVAILEHKNKTLLQGLDMALAENQRLSLVMKSQGILGSSSFYLSDALRSSALPSFVASVGPTTRRALLGSAQLSDLHCSAIASLMNSFPPDMSSYDLLHSAGLQRSSGFKSSNYQVKNRPLKTMERENSPS